MIQMAILYETITEELSYMLFISNICFTVIFIVEAILKLIGYGMTYFDNGWQQFDFFVVISSIFDLALQTFGADAFDFLAVGPQLARVMRVLRVTRVLRLFGKAEGL